MTKLRNEAKGRDCLVRIPGICNFNPETVVLAHLGGAGMGIKCNDMIGAHCCHACHQEIDGAVKSNYTKDELELMHLEGIIRTQEALIKEGYRFIK